ncbi:MAG: glycosyltransferase family 4 protein [Ignavibacteria bacterium]|nr:glycosyltransferase family 4 protein [Ignavibacteria bacterium]MCC7158771.1 glycosyltransferase family 4 protein [Ignavibacteria bacterium]
MKILKSCGSASWGGLEIYFIRTAVELSKMDHDVTILCRANSYISQAAKNADIQFLPILRKGPVRIQSILKLISLLKSEIYDVIHTHLSNDLWTIVPAVKLAGAGSGLVLTKCMASGLKKKDIFHKFLYNRVDKITAVSRFISKNVSETCPVPEEKIIVMHDSISLEEFDPGRYDKASVRKELGFSENNIIVGIIGRMTPGKGYEIFFESVKMITSLKEKMSIRFLAIGASSAGEKEYGKELLNLSNSLGVTDKITFTGFQNDIPKYLLAMDILAFPSNEESFGGTALEAMAMKVPVVAFDSAGVPDIIVDNETGFLVERNNIERFTEALLKLIHDPELRSRFGAAGRKRAKEHFEISANMNTFVELYRSL